MEVISSGRPSHRRRPGYRERRSAPPNIDDRPFSFKIHRSLHQVLDRIKVPESRPFIPDPFQLEALEAIEKSDVLVTAPTGAGKTYIAVKAIESLFARGRKCWYASPLKALSNAKYEEFSEIFGRENVGILTGDRKENSHAPIIVGTTEILRNQLYDTMHEAEDLAVDLVILDEAHYLGDKDRGVVWEEVLIYLPPRIRLLLLSATIRNAQEISDWLEWLRHEPCRWVAAFERPVPLYPLFLFPGGELSPLGTRRGLFAKIRTVDRKSFSRNALFSIRNVMEALRQANLLPAIFFLKSRSDCEKAIGLCVPAPGAEGRKKRDEMAARLEDLLETYPFLSHHQHLPTLRNALVGAHHGGQLPHWKLLMEKLMQEGRLDAIFSTSTVAAGVNFPARTVVVFNSDRFNGKEFVELSATDLLQMTGRAGRRGMDEIGFVLVLPGPYQDPQLVHDLLKSDPDPIASQIRVNFSMALNLLLSHDKEEIHTLFGASLATFQNLYKETEIRGQYEAARRELEKWLPKTACGSAESLGQSRPPLRGRQGKAPEGQEIAPSAADLQILLRVARPREAVPQPARNALRGRGPAAHGPPDGGGRPARRSAPLSEGAHPYLPGRVPPHPGHGGPHRPPPAVEKSDGMGSPRDARGFGTSPAGAERSRPRGFAFHGGNQPGPGGPPRTEIGPAMQPVRTLRPLPEGHLPSLRPGGSELLPSPGGDADHTGAVLAFFPPTFPAAGR